MSSQDTTASSTNSNPMSVLKQARDILDRVKESVKSHGDVYGLFLDELANVVDGGKIHRRSPFYIP